MMRIRADLDACQGFGNCAMNAPEVFDLDDEDMVVILLPEVSQDARPHVEDAVRSCPVAALTIEPM